MFSRPIATRQAVRIAILFYVGVPVVWFAIWLLLGSLAQAMGIKLPQGTDMATLLAILRGILGAIFTVGGLVIALVAVLTQLALEDRVKKAITEATVALETTSAAAQAALNTKYEQELRPELERRAKEQVRAQIAFFRASTAPDWRTKVELTQQALQDDTTLEGAQSWLALQLVDLVITGFENSLRLMPPVQYAPNPFSYRDPSVITPQNVASSGVYMLDPADSTFSGLVTTPNEPVLQQELPTLEALEWLQKAIQSGEDTGDELLWRVPLMYGVLQRYDRMMDAIQQAQETPDKNRLNFQSTTVRLLLTHACGTDVSRLHDLGMLMGSPLPEPHDIIATSVREIDSSKQYQDYVDWYAFLRPTGQPDVATKPTTVRLFATADAHGERSARVLVLDPKGQPEWIPSMDQSSPPPTLDEVISDLEKRFLFIARK